MDLRVWDVLTKTFLLSESPGRSDHPDLGLILGNGFCSMIHCSGLGPLTMYLPEPSLRAVQLVTLSLLCPYPCHLCLILFSMSHPLP